MPATLQQIQARLEVTTALRDEVTEALPRIAPESRMQYEARLAGYQREIEVLLKCERYLIANGRLDGQSDWLTEARFDASDAVSAVLTPSHSSGANEAPREAPRIEASAPPLPSSGDVF